MGLKYNYKIYVFIYLLSLITFSVNPDLSAQDYNYSNFTSENGLSNNTINCIYQDRFGLLWVGTNNGLNKYDGYVFPNYHSVISDSTTLSSDYITSILEDVRGNLWIGTLDGGLNMFDRSNQNFIHYPYKDTESPTPNSINISTMSTDETGNIWIGTSAEGVFKFNIYLNEFTKYETRTTDDNNSVSDSINVIRYIGSSKLLIGTTDGLLIYDSRNNIQITYKHSDKNKNSLKGDYVGSICKDRSGEIWIGTSYSGLQKFYPDSGTFENYTIKKNNKPGNQYSINNIIEDNENNLIISIKDSYEIYKYNKSNNKSEIIDYINPGSLISKEISINTLFVDRTNILWIGNYNYGLSKYILAKPKFGLITFKSKHSTYEIGRKIRAVCADTKNNLWLATNDGLIYYNRQKELFKDYNNMPGSKINFNKYLINTLIEDDNDNLWIGTSGAGIIRFDTRKEKYTIFNYIKNDLNSISSNYIQTLYLDKEKILWIGTADNGINTFDTRLNKFNTIPVASTQLNFLASDNISVISEDNHDNIWIGTYKTGLLRYNKKADRITRFRLDAKNKNSINSDKILSVCEDTNGDLWIGTANGLEKYDNKSDSFTHYVAKDGLLYEVINAILTDDKNNLWMASNNGIIRYKIAENSFRVYNLFDGLQDREYHQSCCKSITGEFYFCGINGINYFYPDSIKDKPNNSSVILTSFKTISNSINYLEDISQGKEINLSYQDNAFSFGFSLLDFKDPSYYTYEYMLKGFDKDWNTAKNTRSANYSNLNSGKYILAVKASNGDNVWSEPIYVSINISTPFWKSLWFYTISIICFLAVMLTIMNRIYYYRKHNRILTLNIDDKSKDLEKTNNDLKKEILKKQKLKETLAYSEEQYRLIVENMIESIIIFRDEIVIYVNERMKQIFDFDFDQMTLDNFLSLIHPEDRFKLKNNYIKSLNGRNRKTHYSVRIKRKDLQERIVEINSARLPNKEKQEIIFFMKDITSRKKAEDEIKNALEKEKELSELRSRFISMTSHEFRTPLTSINTSVEILEKYSEQITQEQKQTNLIRIQENVQKMKRLLNDILMIGKSEAGMYNLKLEPVDINQLCGQIIDEFHTYIMLKTKHKFKYKTDNLNNRVLLDRDLIKQVIENLLTNATKYSPDMSTVFFRMNYSSRFIIIRVKDEGIGIPLEEINNLFVPFYRASNTGEISGSGLGLAIVKRAVELHNGKISLKSEVGIGTEFIVTIPLIKVV